MKLTPREKDKLLNLFQNNDAVIWLAALVGDGACSINPKLTFQINSESVKFLADNFKKRKIVKKENRTRKFYYSSLRILPIRITFFNKC